MRQMYMILCINIIINIIKWATVFLKNHQWNMIQVSKFYIIHINVSVLKGL